MFELLYQPAPARHVAEERVGGRLDTRRELQPCRELDGAGRPRATLPGNPARGSDKYYLSHPEFPQTRLVFRRAIRIAIARLCGGEQHWLVQPQVCQRRISVITDGRRKKGVISGTRRRRRAAGKRFEEP